MTLKSTLLLTAIAAAVIFTNSVILTWDKHFLDDLDAPVTDVSSNSEEHRRKKKADPLTIMYNGNKIVYLPDPDQQSQYEKPLARFTYTGSKVDQTPMEYLTYMYLLLFDKTLFKT